METDNLKEGVLDEQISSVDEFDLKTPDNELLKLFKDCFDNSSSFNTSLRSKAKIATDYYKAKQVSRNDIHEYEEDIVENRFFLSVETVVPIVTANPGEPEIKCLIDYSIATDPETKQQVEKSINDYSTLLENTLLYDYEVTFKLRDKSKKVLRRWFRTSGGIAGFSIYRSALDGKIKVDLIDYERIYVSKDAKDSFVIEYIENTISELIALFPKSESKIEKQYAGTNLKEIGGTKIGYYKFTTHDYTFWKMNEIILDKRRNPNWDYDGIEVLVGTKNIIDETTGEETIEQVYDNKFYNLLERPRHGYFFFTYFKDDEKSPVDQTSYFEQTKTLQDNINRRKRQIALISSGSGILVASQESGLGDSEFEKLDGSPNTKVLVKRGAASAALYRIPPAEVPASALTDLNDSRDAFDNIFGTSATTRGERTGQETARGRSILKEGDMSRHAPLAEAWETFLQEVYMYILHMRLLFSDTQYIIPVANPSTGEEYKNVTFDREKIPFVKVQRKITEKGVERVEEFLTPAPITLLIRRGSTLRKDQAGLYEQAIALWNAKGIDPITFYERLGEKDPQKSYDRQFLANNDPVELLSPELRDKVIAKQAEAAQRALADQSQKENTPPA